MLKYFIWLTQITYKPEWKSILTQNKSALAEIFKWKYLELCIGRILLPCDRMVRLLRPIRWTNRTVVCRPIRRTNSRTRTGGFIGMYFLTWVNLSESLRRFACRRNISVLSWSVSTVLRYRQYFLMNLLIRMENKILFDHSLVLFRT